MLWLPLLVAAADPGCAIAILDFEKGKKAAPASAKVLADALAIELGARTGCRILTASDIRSMADFEAVKQSMGCDDGACLAELGGALGVDRVVTGDVAVLDEDSVVINARLSETKSASVVGRANLTAKKSPADVRAAAPAVAAALLGEAPPPSGPPLGALVAGGSGVVVSALGGVAVALGESTLATASSSSSDKESALLLSRVGAVVVGLGVVGVAASAVWLAVGGDA